MTGHKDPNVHIGMLRTNFPFDAVQMPLNPFDATFEFSFERLVLPELQRRGTAALGMKPMGGTAEAVKKGVVTAEELLRYAMSGSAAHAWFPAGHAAEGSEGNAGLRNRL